MILEASCRHTTPSGRAIISQDTMKVILWQMFLADAYNEARSYKDTNFRHDSAYATLYTEIFRSHHISREDFSESFDYYLGRPSEVKTIVDSLVSQKNSRDLMKRGVFPGPQSPQVHPLPVSPIPGQHLPPPGVHPGLPPHPAKQDTERAKERPAALGGHVPVQ